MIVWGLAKKHIETLGLNPEVCTVKVFEGSGDSTIRVDTPEGIWEFSSDDSSWVDALVAGYPAPLEDFAGLLVDNNVVGELSKQQKFGVLYGQNVGKIGKVLKAELSMPDAEEIVASGVAKPVGILSGLSKKEIQERMGGDRVELRDAENIYTPVHGTSLSSKYFCVAVRPDLKVAARIRSADDVSVRIDGDCQAHIEDILAVGFKASSGSHYSMHVSIDANVDRGAERAVLGVLGGLRINFDQVATNLAPLAGAL